MQMKKKYKNILEIVFISLTSVIICIVGIIFYERNVEIRKNDAESILKFYKEKIVLEIRGQLNYGKSLAEMVALNPENLDWIDNKFKEMNIRKEVLFIYFVKGDKVEKVFPKKEHSKNLGKTLNELSYVYTMAKILKEPVIEGPLSLQFTDKKGYLFINPIIYKDEYIGEIVVALDENFVLNHIELDYLKNKGYEFELWHIDSQDGKKNVVAVSDTDRDFSYGAKNSFYLPTEWTLSIIPTNGWVSLNSILEIILICILIELFLLGGFFYWIKYKRMKKIFSELDYIETSTGLYNYKGFLRNLIKRLEKNSETFSLFYFVIENFNSVSQLMGEEEKNQFLKNVSQIIKNYIQNDHIIGHVGESNFLIAVFEDMEDQTMADITKGLSLELLWKVKLDDKKKFLNTYYQYIKVLKDEEEPIKFIKKIIKDYYSEKMKKSPIVIFTKKCYELIEGKTNIIFDEYNDHELLELSIALNKYHKKMEKIAYYDSVFDIGNRLKYTRDSDILITYNKKRKFTLYCIDIHNFSKYNELFNIETGDGILKETSKRLKKLFGDYTYRINGDVFIGIDFSKKSYEDIVENIKNELGEPIYINELKFILKVNIGVCIYPLHAQTSDKLLEKVQVSLGYAKSYQTTKAIMYNEILNNIIDEEKKILYFLENNLNTGKLEVWYQPIWNIKKNDFTAAEALIRLKNDEGGYFPAIQVIEIAEKNGIVEKIGNYVLDHACKFMKNYGEDLKLERIGINMSIQQFLVEDYVDNILKIIDKNKISPNKISLEITETLLINSLSKMNSIILELKKANIDIVLDDFGKGYSSLNYLSNLQVNIIKVDKSLVNNIVNSPKQLLILKSIIEMAKINNMKIVIEGIEREEEQKLVSALGIDYIQGFYYAKPMPEKNLIEILKNKIKNNYDIEN